MASGARSRGDSRPRFYDLGPHWSSHIKVEASEELGPKITNHGQDPSRLFLDLDPSKAICSITSSLSPCTSSLVHSRWSKKKTEWTSDVAVFLLCRHHGGGPANLPRWPVKLVYQATIEIGTCCVTSEDQRGAVSLLSQYGDRAGVALLLPGRLDGQTHMAPALFLFLFLFSSSSTTYFRGSMFWGAGFRAGEQGPRITVCRSDGKQGNNWWTYTVGRHSVCV